MTPARWILWLVGRGPWVFPSGGENPLVFVEEFVARRFPSVAHVPPATLAEQLSAAENAPVLFDVRTREEFAAGHIAGAIHVAPDLGSATFARRFGDVIAGRAIVFYCSVGMRSSRLAERLRVAQVIGRAASVANLRGGIFRWDDEGRPITAAGPAATRVHPFSRFWQRFRTIRR